MGFHLPGSEDLHHVAAVVAPIHDQASVIGSELGGDAHLRVLREFGHSEQRGPDGVARGDGGRIGQPGFHRPNGAHRVVRVARARTSRRSQDQLGTRFEAKSVRLSRAAMRALETWGQKDTR
jgi:hypothetical protein